MNINFPLTFSEIMLFMKSPFFLFFFFPFVFELQARDAEESQ